MLRKLELACLFCGIMGFAGAANAAVIMDATTHNGSFIDRPVGTYWNNAANNPSGWLKSGSYVYNGALFLQAYAETEIYNNTGELVTPGHEYTLSADLGDRELAKIDVYVRATQNADGTGASSDLAHVSRTGTDQSSFALYTVTDTGAAASGALAGYYLQVKVITDANSSGQTYFFNNLVVSSAASVPEPASLATLFIAGALLARRRQA